MSRSGTSSSAYGAFYHSSTTQPSQPPGFRVLPKRESIKDSQPALIAALASPRGSPSRPTTAQQPSQGDLLMLAKAKRQAAKPNGSVPIPEGPPCDRCDGDHKTHLCPHFKGNRDDHEDATVGIGKGGQEADDAPPIIVCARVVSQPGDGSWCDASSVIEQASVRAVPRTLSSRDIAFPPVVSQSISFDGPLLARAPFQAPRARDRVHRVQSRCQHRRWAPSSPPIHALH